MLDQQFEDFIVNELISWIDINSIPGSRFQFKLSDPRIRKSIHAAFKTHAKEEIIVSGVNIPYVKLKGKSIIPLLHSEEEIDGYNQDYLAFLRDELQKKDYFPVSPIIIFLHDSNLDTINNSSDDLTQNERVLSISYFRNIMGKLILQKSNSNFYKILLDYQTENMLEDNSSILSYKNLYNCIQTGSINLARLGLFKDSAVEHWDNKKQIRNRIDDNKSIHSIVKFQVDNFPSQLDDKLSSLFSSQFIKKHFSSEKIELWEDLEFETIKLEIESNKKPNIDFINISTKDDIVINLTEEGKTAAAKRRKHIIIECPSTDMNFEMAINFEGQGLKEADIVYNKDDDIFKEVKINNTGLTKKIIVTVSIVKGVTFFSLNTSRRNKTSDKYYFNFLVVLKGQFYIDGFINNFLLSNDNKVKLLTNETSMIINSQRDDIILLQKNSQLIDVRSHGKVDFSNLIESTDNLEFTLTSLNDQLTFTAEEVKSDHHIKMPLIFDKERYRKLLDDTYFGIYDASNKKIYIDNRTIEPSDKDLILLDEEYYFLKNRITNLIRAEGLSLDGLKEIDESLYNDYSKLYDYLNNRNSVLSLVSWGEELRAIVSNLVDNYLLYIENIPFASVLTEQQKNIINLGVLEKEKEIFITPFHPLNLAYFLQLTTQIKNDFDCSKDGVASFYSLPSITLRRLNIRGLIPFFYNSEKGFSYVNTIENNNFWLKVLPNFDNEYDYVPKLVKDKICEFEVAFEELFQENGCLIINAINQNKAKELFNGIVKFFKSQLEQPNVLSIHLNFYDYSFIYNTFDEFSDSNDIHALCNLLELKTKKDKEQVYALTDLMRSNITFNKYEHSAINKTAYNYAHLSFFNNDNEVSSTSVKVEEQPNGLCASGLICSEASQSENGSYFTSFGLKDIDYNSVKHLKLAKIYSSLIVPAWKENCKYNGAETIGIAVSGDFKNLLKNVYDSSLWTVIIDPKVTLDFFSKQEMLLIHFSDNYTHSAGYDAVTVSQSETLFSKLLNKGMGSKISEFNAFNGKWLLQLLTSTDKSRKGLEGEVAAYKLATSILRTEDVTWVPMSIGETVRASKNIGLKLDDTEMSITNEGISGPISDDILMVGFNGDNIIFIPLEVKTGKGADLSKAVKQVKSLANHFNTLFMQDNLKSVLYKSLFAKQVLSQVEKYDLYHIFPENYFDVFFGMKEKLLSGKYSVEAPKPYEGIIISHIENDYVFQTKCEVIDCILHIEIPSMTNQLISTPLSEMIDSDFLLKYCGIPRNFLLSKQQDSTVHTYSNYDSNDSSLKQTLISNINTDKINYIKPKDEDKILNGNFYIDRKSDSGTTFIEDDISSISIKLGHNVLGLEEVHWDIENTLTTMNTNTGIIGTMGTGKTQFTKSIITQLINNGGTNKELSILIFDYKSDYIDEDFISTNKGNKFKPYCLPYNPLSLYGNIPLLPVHTARVFSETLGKAFSLGVKQQLRLRKILAEAYELKGIYKNDEASWKNPAPTLTDVWGIYLETHPEQDSLYAALESLIDLEVFEPSSTECMPLFDFISGVTVIELAQYPTTIQSLVVALTLDQFYSQMQKNAKPQVKENYRKLTKMILVDEADNFMSEDYESLRKILKEGREYGVGMILSTQDITHFQTGDNDYSSYIFTWFVHKVAKIKNQDIKSIFNVADKVGQDSLMESINTLETHYCLYVDGKKNIIKLHDFAFWQLMKELNI